MAGFIIITGEGSSRGFKCAGLDCREVREGEDVSGLLVSLQNEGRYGLVAIEEGLLGKVPENVMRRIKRKGLPLIVPINIPARWEEVEFGESPAVRLIRKAIGYQIKIRR